MSNPRHGPDAKVSRGHRRSSHPENDHRHKRLRTDDYRHAKTSDRRALPSGASSLSKSDLDEFRNLFGLYLDVQKQIDIKKLDDHELKGRWKSFLGKWNRGELSAGYYDPSTKQRADDRGAERGPSGNDAQREGEIEEYDEDDEYGPARPQQSDKGATVPNRQDLRYRAELVEEDRADDQARRRLQRKLEKTTQKERLEELAPRAEPGSKERQLEKKREKSDANRSFREARSPGAEEVKEGDLMGDEGIEGYKARIKENERRKTEREIRKEEVLRARAAEREVRLSEHRAKEDKTMEMLKAIAKQRFG